MTYRARALLNVIAPVLVLACLVAVGIWLWAKEPPGTTKSDKEPPATLSKSVKEDEFNTITLTPQAEKRLGIQTTPVEKRKIERVRTFGGDVTVPIGRATVVSSPLSGTLKAPAGGIPKPGQKVAKGQAIYLLLPLLTPEGRTTLAAQKVEAEGNVTSAKVQLEAAQVALTRAQRLVKEEAGSQRIADEAKAAFDIAGKALEAAQARSAVLSQALGEAADGTASPLTIPAPDDGLLRSVSVSEGQLVPSGTVLFEVVNEATVWVRVPVYVGEVADVAVDKPAAVGSLADQPGSPRRLAKPTSAPPSADPIAATVDLYYELENKDSAYSPGQRVGVTLQLRGQEESLVVPWSGVIIDIHGNNWVYENTVAHAYVRRRVQVRHVSEDTAVLASGPKVGARVVSEGAAELFGTEVGFGK